MSNGKVLMVKDVKTNDWGFISGGVKKNETYTEAALRELKEETSGILSTFPTKMCKIEIPTYYRPEELMIIDKQRNSKVRSIYLIFIYYLDNNDINLKYFKRNKEISDIKFDYFLDNQQTWDFCRDLYIKYIQYR